MPNTSKLNVPIGANLAGLRSGLSKAGKMITSFGEGVESKLGNVSLGNLDRQIGNISSSSLKAVPSANKLARSMKNVQRPAQNTTSAVINFNRVIQDAPFGIIGVANNLEPMITSFQQLQRTSGSTTGALKTLLTSAFTGPGALITVVSVASSLMLAFGDDLFSAGKDAEEAEKSFDGLNNQIDVMVKAVDRLSEFEDPFGLASLENELRAIASRESVLQGQVNRLQEIEEEITKIGRASKDAGPFDEGNEARQQQLLLLIQERKQIEENFGTESELKEKIQELDERKLKTQQDLNTSQDALNSGLVKEAEARSKLLHQLRQQASDDFIFEPQLPSVEQLLADAGLSDGLRVPIKFPTDVIFEEEINTNLTNVKGKIEETGDEIQKTGELGQFVGRQLGQAFAQAAIFADDLGQSIQNIGKQLLSKGIMDFFLTVFTGGPTGFFSKSGIFGGIFHSGGMVPGNMTQERLILAKGGEQVLTPSQQSTIGRGGTVHVTGEFVQRGSDLVAVINQTNQGTLR